MIYLICILSVVIGVPLILWRFFRRQSRIDKEVAKTLELCDAIAVVGYDTYARLCYKYGREKAIEMTINAYKYYH